MEACLKIANANQQKVFLLGAENDVVKTAQHKLAENTRILFLITTMVFDLSDEMVLKQVTSFDPVMCLLAWVIQDKNNG